MALWLIACKYTGENLIGPCVESIQTHHPGDRILVVDSCSEDRSYLDELPAGVDVALGNKRYPVGAWRAARTRDWNFCYFIHDSTTLAANISHIEEAPCSVYATFGQEHNTELTDYQNKVLGKLGIVEPPYWSGVMGPMLMCQRSVYQRLRGAGLFACLPKSKFESNGWERLVGMLLAHLAIPITHEVAPWMVKHYRERG